MDMNPQFSKRNIINKIVKSNKLYYTLIEISLQDNNT